MKRLLCVVCMGLAVGAGASAQTAKGQMDKSMMKNGPMTVSGCVTAGTGAGEFMLSNAMMMMDKAMDKEMMDKDKMSQPGMAEHMMSYQLVGGHDLKAHLGHKVEVMGTVSKSDMEKSSKMDKMGTTDKDKMAHDQMKAMKLKVSSVKMISATCP